MTEIHGGTPKKNPLIRPSLTRSDSGRRTDSKRTPLHDPQLRAEERRDRFPLPQRDGIQSHSAAPSSGVRTPNDVERTLPSSEREAHT